MKRVSWIQEQEEDSKNQGDEENDSNQKSDSNRCVNNRLSIEQYEDELVSGSSDSKYESCSLCSKSPCCR